MNTFVMSIPLPARELSPNNRNGRHWAATSNIVANARNEAKVAVLERLGGKPSPFANEGQWHYRIHIFFVLKDNRKRDLDNLKAALKPSIDGMCDALGIDDGLIVGDTQEKIVDRENAQVLILVEQIPRRAVTFKLLDSELYSRFGNRISASMFHVKHSAKR